MTDEKTLIAGLNKQDKNSFEELVNLYKDLVFNVCAGLIQNIDDADDLTQDVYIEVFNSISSFKGESSLKTWIYRIAVNKSLELIRKKNRKKRFAHLVSIFSGNEEMVIPDFEHPGVKAENKERAAILFNAISKLPESQRIAFTLSKVEELSYKEISDIMKISVSAIESLLFRAKANLKKRLEKYYKEQM